MRLVDIDEIGVMPIDITDLPYDRCLLTYLKEDIDNAPTVKAIPLDKVEQIKEEIAYAMDMEPAWKGQDNYVGGLEIALSIIDKALKEQTEGADR